MSQALYRKYRSKKLSEVVGQAHITTTLAHALEMGKISHAYLFTGPRGVGKTSVARILAHEINGLPYTDDSMHLDIIEIDAASNRRIDEIRDLRDRVNVAPTSAKFKVYIIDEVHMLTREAFNALLKTLEEPPAHVVFILATTESHKLPETIVSRTQRFTFKPVPLEQVVEHLRAIAQSEKIKISDDALQLIAAHGEGSFRDSISLLDQASGSKDKIDARQIQTLLGTPPPEAVRELAAALLEKNAALVITVLTRMREQGFGSAQIAKHLGEAWRNRILEAGQASPADFELLQKLLDVPTKQNSERYLEIILLEFALTINQVSATDMAIVPGSPERFTGVPKAQPAAPEPASDPETVDGSAPNTEDSQQKTDRKKDTATQAKLAAHNTFDETVWPDVLAALRKKSNTLYGIVRMAVPEFGKNTLELGFSFPFHKKRLSESKNQRVIIDIIQELTGQTVAVNCVLIKGQPEPVPAAKELAEAAQAVTKSVTKAAAQPDIASISNIFGGGELLES